MVILKNYHHQELMRETKLFKIGEDNNIRFQCKDGEVVTKFTMVSLHCKYLRDLCASVPAWEVKEYVIMLPQVSKLHLNYLLSLLYSGAINFTINKSCTRSALVKRITETAKLLQIDITHHCFPEFVKQEYVEMDDEVAKIESEETAEEDPAAKETDTDIVAVDDAILTEPEVIDLTENTEPLGNIDEDSSLNTVRSGNIDEDSSLNTEPTDINVENSNENMTANTNKEPGSDDASTTTAIVRTVTDLSEDRETNTSQKKTEKQPKHNDKEDSTKSNFYPNEKTFDPAVDPDSTTRTIKPPKPVVNDSEPTKKLKKKLISLPEASNISPKRRKKDDVEDKGNLPSTTSTDLKEINRQPGPSSSNEKSSESKKRREEEKDRTVYKLKVKVIRIDTKSGICTLEGKAQDICVSTFLKESRSHLIKIKGLKSSQQLIQRPSGGFYINQGRSRNLYPSRKAARYVYSEMSKFQVSKKFKETKFKKDSSYFDVISIISNGTKNFISKDNASNKLRIRGPDSKTLMNIYNSSISGTLNYHSGLTHMYRGNFVNMNDFLSFYSSTDSEEFSKIDKEMEFFTNSEDEDEEEDEGEEEEEEEKNEGVEEEEDEDHEEENVGEEENEGEEEEEENDEEDEDEIL